MPILTIMRGVSGSGKSTVARREAAKTKAVVVSRDLIRLALYDDPREADEGLVTLFEDAWVDAALGDGRDVIVDDTNITWDYVQRLQFIGVKNNAEAALLVLDVPLDTCIKNNDHRAMMGGRHVPHDVIKRQYRRFQENKDWTL